MLSSQDSAHLEQALRVMLAPQAYGEGRTWGDAVCASVSALLPEAMVGLMRITPGGPFTHTPLPLADQVAYVRHYASLDPAAAPQVARRLEVAHRWSLVPRDEVRGTEFHEDWLRPRRLEDALWLNTFDGAKLRHRIFLSFDAVLATDQRARMETLLRLLAPAFRAGTAALDQHGSDPDVLLRTLDALAHGAMLVDADGRTRHRSATLERLLAADPERPRLEAALSSAAQAVAALAFDRPSARSRSHGPPLRPAERQVATRARTYTVRATLVVGDVPRTLVELIPAGAAAPAPAIQPISRSPSPSPIVGAGTAASDGLLRRRFGLTPQEVAVARLLEQRRTDAEVGAALGISPNTARTHAERVRRKLGVARRTDVAAAIVRASSADH